MTVRATLEQALQHHQAGQLQQAEGLYREILRLQPGQPDALNLLGVLANQVGQPEVAARLEDIACHHRHYARLMEHWRRVLPVPIHEVVYEDLVADQQAVSRKLVAACGLGWDDRCLEFYRTERVVQTASKLQVRRPIYHSSVGRWKAFEAHPEPLRLALGIAQTRSRHTEPITKFEGCHAC